MSDNLNINRHGGFLGRWSRLLCRVYVTFRIKPLVAQTHRETCVMDVFFAIEIYLHHYIYKNRVPSMQLNGLRFFSYLVKFCKMKVGSTKCKNTIMMNFIFEQFIFKNIICKHKSNTFKPVCVMYVVLSTMFRKLSQHFRVMQFTSWNEPSIPLHSVSFICKFIYIDQVCYIPNIVAWLSLSCNRHICMAL